MQRWKGKLMKILFLNARLGLLYSLGIIICMLASVQVSKYVLFEFCTMWLKCCLMVVLFWLWCINNVLNVLIFQMTTSMCYFYVLKKKVKDLLQVYERHWHSVCVCVSWMYELISAFKDTCFINGTLERSNINNCHGIDRSFILMPSEPR